MDKYEAYDVISPFIGRLFRDKSILPIIYYHSIVDNGGLSYQHTNFSVFKQHMVFLKDEGYEFLSFKELPFMFKKQKKDKKILIAFDDGYEDNYTRIFEFMNKERIKYNIFLTTSFIGSKGYLNNDQILRMNSSGLVDFGVHTHTHINCSVEYQRLPMEIEQSNKAFCDLLGAEPKDFCFPFGSYSTISVRMIRELGKYKRVYTSDFLRPTDVAGMCITGRLGIRNEDSIRVLKHKIDGDYYPLRMFVDTRVPL